MLSKVKSLNYYPKPLSEIPEESFTLPSYMYTDIEIYELEKEKIFYKTWQYVAHKSLFAEPGDYVTLRICDQHIFVIMVTTLNYELFIMSANIEHMNYYQRGLETLPELLFVLTMHGLLKKLVN